jgi:hypothetical protein
MIRLILAASGLCVLALAPLDSDAVTGNQLQGYCGTVAELMAGRKVYNDFEAGRCLGYADGFISGVTAERSAQQALGRPPSRQLFCIPNGVTTGQAVQVSLRYLQQHPADLHMDAGDLLYFAFMDAFPCKEALK